MLPLIKRSFLLESLYFVIIFLLCSLETTTWYFLFPQLTLPTLWFIFISYLALFRSISIFTIYSLLIALIVGSFTVAPFFNLYASILVSGAFLAYLQSQFYVRDRLYFSAYTAVSFFVYSITLSLFNINFYSFNYWSASLTKAIIISIISFFIFPFCQLLDDKNREQTHINNMEMPL